MSSTFTAVDLSRLPAPTIVETLDFETILAAVVAEFRKEWPDFDATVESDPVYKILQRFAYRELWIRQHFNDRARGALLAFAVGADLDHLAAFFNVQRLLLDPGDALAVPPRPAVYEPDVDLRRRVQLAFEGLSTAGPEGAYLFHALGAHPDVLDASASSPSPGEVVVTVLSRVGTGSPAADVLIAVEAALNADDVRPLTDQVTVQAATIVDYTIAATLTLWPGPDSSVVLTQANANLEAYVERQRRLGRDITRSGLFAALHVEGVQNVVLTAPAADLVITAAQAANCTDRTVTVIGVGE
jgi:phage-related baseplate assembly protein